MKARLDKRGTAKPKTRLLGHAVDSLGEGTSAPYRVDPA